MEINRLGEDKYEVIHDGKVEVLSLNEVVVLLSQPETHNKDKTIQEQLEEFWRDCPAYPRM